MAVFKFFYFKQSWVNDQKIYSSNDAAGVEVGRMNYLEVALGLK